MNNTKNLPTFNHYYSSMKKKRVWLIFWWLSNEHDVSLLSAKNVEKYIDKEKYTLVCIYRNKQGKISIVDSVSEYLNGEKLLIEDIKNHIDTTLLMTHGKYGEDGKLQSILELFHIPYCWCRVLSSALCMDKWIFKLFLQWHQIPQTPFEILDIQLDSPKDIEQKKEKIFREIKFPLYIKPANSWSSVGITKVNEITEFNDAIKTASLHDNKIIIEQWLISPKEIEVAILWNSDLLISEPGELILAKDFYDYDDKYTNNQSSIHIPASITESQRKEIQELAEKVYKLCDCSGFARIDFFLSEWKIYLNEINTLPGFTDISMFPMLMKYMWLSYSELIDKIIALAY